MSSFNFEKTRRKNFKCEGGCPLPPLIKASFIRFSSPMFEKDNVFFEKPLSQWTESESKRAKFDCITKNIITSALNSNEFFRVSKCGSAKEMWDTLEVTHEGTNEIERTRRRSQTRRKRKQNKKEANLCLMAKEKDDASSVSSCTSLNA